MQENSKLPGSLKEFWLYYWRFDPKTWTLFIVQDVIHFSRYPVAFIFIGIGIDALARHNPAEGVPATAWLMALAVFFILALGESVHIWTAYIIRKWKPRLRKKVRSDFFAYALGHSHAYFQDHFAGSLARKVSEVAESCIRLPDHLRFSILGSITGMTTAMISMFFVSPVYATGLLLFMISIILPLALRLKKIGLRARVFSEARASVTGTIVDILTNVSAMRNFANTVHEKAVHSEASKAEQQVDQKRMLTLIQIENYRRISLILLGSGMFIALLLGWQQGIVTVGQMSAVMGQTMMLVGAAWMIGWGVIMVADEIGYIDDAIRMITPPHDVTDKQDARTLKTKDGRIVFDHVRFRYPGQPVFDDLSLEIAPGEKLGLMGPSGAGKSTLVSILLRLFDIQDGQILIDGQNIADVTQDSLRRQVAVIPQDTSLFHRSLYDNIRYGRLDASDEEVIEAAKKAYAHDFISELKDGYETEVGERGIKLSGGQRQRIAIARAILKDAPILILDEATSSLDSESEKHIQDSLADLMEGKTVIAIAHRLSTIAHLDRLIVMDEGRIIEEGTHQKLLKQNGLYARLWQMQSGGFIGADEQKVSA